MPPIDCVKLVSVGTPQPRPNSAVQSCKHSFPFVSLRDGAPPTPPFFFLFTTSIQFSFSMGGRPPQPPLLLFFSQLQFCLNSRIAGVLMRHMSHHEKCRYGRITVSFNGKIEKVEKVALGSVMLFHTNIRSLFLTSTPNSKWGPYSRTRFSLMLVSCFTRRARDKLR